MNTNLRILQIGAGSMGKRRLRDLHQRKDVKLAVYDERKDRRAEASNRFGVPTFERLEEALAWGPNALIISTPPGAKKAYIDLAIDRRLHHFSEADIWTYGTARRAVPAELVMCPSATLIHLPIVKALRSIVSDDLGAVLTYHHVLGSYMPAWHPDEGDEYYGRHRSTAPAREMVCFELHFLNAVFGRPSAVAGCLGKFGVLPNETEDTWALLIRLADGGTGQLSSTMACPTNSRSGVCTGTRGCVTWDLISGEVTLSTQSAQAVRKMQYGSLDAVLERTYLEEINLFVEAMHNRQRPQWDYASSQQATATLAAAEESALRGSWIKIDPDAEPSLNPSPGSLMV